MTNKIFFLFVQTYAIIIPQSFKLYTYSSENKIM